MSDMTTTEDGYGFSLFTGTNASNILEFFKNHEETFRQASNEKTFKQYYTALDELEDKAENDGYLDEDTLMEGFGEIFEGQIADAIALIIKTETGARGFYGFENCRETNTVDTVMYVMSFPWQMTDKEKDFTSEDVDAILKRYAEELGVPADEIYDQQLVYFC